MSILSRKIRFTKQEILIFFFTIVFFCTSLGFIFPSGWKTCDKITGDCSIAVADYHAHDAFWHMAIAETAFRSFPPIHPDFASVRLTNYNYLFDWFLYLLNYVFGISPLHGYFHVFPVLTSTLYIIAVLYVIKILKLSPNAKVATALFLFLGNSFAFIMTLFSSGTLVGSSTRGFPLVLSLQPTIMFYNNQFALSLVFILLTIAIINKPGHLSPKKTTIIGALVAITTALKVYGGVALLLYVFTYFAIFALSNKKQLFRVAAGFFVVLIFFLSITFAIGGSGKGVFTYDPLALIRSLIDDPSHLFDNNIALARSTLEASGKFSPRLISIYIVATTIFFLINFGARVVGFFHILEIMIKKIFDPHLVATLFSTIILSVVPLILLQKGDWWNTIQFLYYAVFLSSFLAGEFVGSLKGTTKFVVYVVVVISILIPTVDQWRYVIYRNDVIISKDFVEATNTLRKLPYGTVSTYGQIAPDSRLPAFTGMPLTIGNIPILRNTLVEYKSKEMNFLKDGYDRSADYIFMDKTKTTNWGAKMSNRTKIFENSQYVIYAHKTPSL